MSAKGEIWLSHFLTPADIQAKEISASIQPKAEKLNSLLGCAGEKHTLRRAHSNKRQALLLRKLEIQIG